MQSSSWCFSHKTERNSSHDGATFASQLLTLMQSLPEPLSNIWWSQGWGSMHQGPSVSTRLIQPRTAWLTLHTSQQFRLLLALCFCPLRKSVSHRSDSHLLAVMRWASPAQEDSMEQPSHVVVAIQILDPGHRLWARIPRVYLPSAAILPQQGWVSISFLSQARFSAVPFPKSKWWQCLKCKVSKRAATLPAKALWRPRRDPPHWLCPWHPGKMLSLSPGNRYRLCQLVTTTRLSSVPTSHMDSKRNQGFWSSFF